jgi:putative ABC transport system substrate-binding protein
MRRRHFIKLIGGTALCPIRATAQQTERVRQIGVLMSYPEREPEAQNWTRTFVQALEARGWRDGDSLKLHYRWRVSNSESLQTGASELAALGLDAILAGATPAAVALKKATQSIPVIFANVADPVEQGLVASLTRPGGNITGFAAFEFSIAGKWVQGLKDLVPSTKQIGIILNAETAPFYRRFLPFLDVAAQRLEIVTHLVPIENVDQIPDAIERLAKQTQGLIVFPGAQFTANKDVIIRTTARLSIPAMYCYTFWVTAGGLISYGFDPNDMFRRAATYVDNILKGPSPENCQCKIRRSSSSRLICGPQSHSASRFQKHCSRLPMR